MTAPRSAWVVVASSPFGRHLAVVEILFWLFSHAVASVVSGVGGAPPFSVANTLWVVMMTLGLLAVELRRKRLKDFLATVGFSGSPLWCAALIGVGILETMLWVARTIGGGV